MSQKVLVLSKPILANLTGLLPELETIYTVYSCAPQLSCDFSFLSDRFIVGSH